ncbi:21921_t:CDS:1, partial [Racocetra persica]
MSNNEILDETRNSLEKAIKTSDYITQSINDNNCLYDPYGEEINKNIAEI